MSKIKHRILITAIFSAVFFHPEILIAQTIIRIAFQVPIKHHLAQNVIDFKREIEEESKGSIIVQVNDYGSFLKQKDNKKNPEKQKLYFKDNEILAAVKDGVIEAGMLSLPRFSSSLPMIDIFYQPFLFDTKKKVATATAPDSIIRKTIDAAVKNTGSTVLWWQPYGSVINVSDGKPVQNPDQMRDKKVRVFSKTLGNLVIASGGEPVLISNSKQYFSYKHGKVDIGMTTIADIKSKKIWEVMDTISITNHASIQFLVIVNSRWWNFLDNRKREIISKASLNAELRSNIRMKELEIESYQEALKNGMNLVVLSDDDRDFWKEKSGPIYKKYLEDSGEDGQLLFDIANVN